VHPEAYPVVRRILTSTGQEIKTLIGNGTALRAIKPAEYVDDKFGLPTVTDILRELEKPGRDPRPAFRTATFKEGVEKPSDLEPGMLLEGVVTNVAAFGAFVDVGVHQDGLVHVSAMSRTYIKDPREVVKPGDVVRVKVLDVDLPRQRISLTLRLDDEPQRPRGGSGPGRGEQSGERGQGGGERNRGGQNRANQNRDGQNRDGQNRDTQNPGTQNRAEPARGPRRDQGRNTNNPGNSADTALADALRRAGLVK
jgi:uncharacterized protein